MVNDVFSGDCIIGGALGCGGATGVCNHGDCGIGGACALGGAGFVATLGDGSVSRQSTVGISITTPVLVTFVVSRGEHRKSWCMYCC